MWFRLCRLVAVMSVAFGATSGRMADGREWTTGNLNMTVASSYCYGDAAKSCLAYGRLYAWEAARRGCESLGGGWRLPTDEEWRQLAKAYGGVSADAEDKGKAAYEALMVGGRSGFGAVLGGGRDEKGEYARGDAHGFYWTASASEGGRTYYNFGRGGLALHRQSGGEPERAFSVRCVR